MNRQDFILPCSLGCLNYGIWISFCEIFDCYVNWRSYLIPAFLIAGVVVFLLKPWNWRITLGILGVGAAGLLWYCFRHYERLFMEADGICYYIDQKYYDYFGTSLFEECHEYSMQNTIIWILLGVLFSIFITIFAFRLGNFQYGFLPCYLIVFAGLFMGKAPGVRGILFLTVGIVLALFWFHGRDRGGRSYFYMIKRKGKKIGWQRYAVFFPLLVAVLFVAGHLTGKTEKNLLSHAQQVQRTQLRLENKITGIATELSKYIQGSYSVDSNGRLNNNEPKYAERPVMKLTLEEKPRADIYLKGFVGSHYNNGKWKREDVEQFEKLFSDTKEKSELISMADFSLFNWMHGSVYYTIDEYNSLELFRGIGSLKKEMKIEHVEGGKWSKYTYFPYFSNVMEMTDVQEGRRLEEMDSDFLKGDSSRAKASSAYYAYYSDLTDYERRNYYRIGQQSFLDYSSIKGKSKEKLKDYLETVDSDVLRRYLEYAWIEYGYQKESSFLNNQDFLKELEEKHFHNKILSSFYIEDSDFFYYSLEQADTMERVKVVQDILWEGAVYSKQLEKVPVGEDYAEYFLLQQKKGFCEHFATAGTLLMRELGIPSRYVGGYKISIDRFKKNEDGKYEAEVLDSDAHAWTEVLMGQLGWFMADMTPASSSSRERTNVATKKPAPVTATPRQSEKKPTSKPTPTVKPTPKTETTAVPKSVGKGNSKAKGGIPKEVLFAAKAAAGIGGIFLLFVIWILCCRGYYAARRKKLLWVRERNRNLSVRMELHELLSYLKKCGVAVSVRMTEQQWSSVIEKLCEEFFNNDRDFGSKEREELLRIVQKAAFSEKKVTPEEHAAFLEYCGRLEKIAQKKAGKLRRVYLKLMGKYGRI